MIAAAIALAAAPAATVAAVGAVEEPDPKAMTQTEIRSFNAGLPRAHPFYIRCEKVPETGSLVKKLFSCRTNQQWQKAEDVGNDAAREAGDHFRPKFLEQSG